MRTNLFSVTLALKLRAIVFDFNWVTQCVSIARKGQLPEFLFIECSKFYHIAWAIYSMLCIAHAAQAFSPLISRTRLHRYIGDVQAFKSHRSDTELIMHFHSIFICISSVRINLLMISDLRFPRNQFANNRRTDEWDKPFHCKNRIDKSKQLSITCTVKLYMNNCAVADFFLSRFKIVSIKLIGRINRPFRSGAENKEGEQEILRTRK